MDLSHNKDQSSGRRAGEGGGGRKQAPSCCVVGDLQNCKSRFFLAWRSTRVPDVQLFQGSAWKRVKFVNFRRKNRLKRDQLTDKHWTNRGKLKSVPSEEQFQIVVIGTSFFLSILVLRSSLVNQQPTTQFCPFQVYNRKPHLFFTGRGEFSKKVTRRNLSNGLPTTLWPDLQPTPSTVKSVGACTGVLNRFQTAKKVEGSG
jgi:hypothetical protein